MSDEKESIVNAGNTEVPAYLAIIEMGYSISLLNESSEAGSMWVAKKEETKFVASNPLELLGLITMRERRGLNWKASDREIDDYLAQFSME